MCGRDYVEVMAAVVLLFCSGRRDWFVGKPDSCRYVVGSRC